MPDATQIVAVFGSSQSIPGDAEYQQAVACGRLLAAAGFGVATGGYGGTMEGVSKGAAEAGGTVIAVTAPPLFPMRDGPNSFVHREDPRPTLTTRLTGLLDSSVASISLPGSIGTFTELMVAWNRAFLEDLGNRPVHPVIAVGEKWATLVRHLSAELGSGHLVTTVDSAEDAVDHLIRTLND